MMVIQRNERDSGGSAKPGSLLSALTLALVLGGCSADVGRFDFPAFNLNGDSGATGALPTPSEPMDTGVRTLPGGSTFSGGTYVPPSSRNTDRVDMAALPEPSAPAAPPSSYREPAYGSRSLERSASYERPSATHQPARPLALERSTSPAAGGGSVEVQRGDTLYGIARANGVKVKDLMATNGLTNAMIRPGQTLRLPGAGDEIAAPRTAEPAPRSLAAAPAAPAARTQTPAIPAEDWRGSYQVQSGDSLYRIARQHDVRVADLQRANNITNPRQLRPGITLRVPGAGNAASTSVAAISGASATEPQAPRMIQSTTQPTVINSGERRLAALNTGRITDASPASTASSGAKAVQTIAITPSQIGTGTLRWPSKGKVVSGFGQRPDGTHNDGVNIAVPKGTDVHAAAEGEVAYAGSELKGYGNLILLRHDNGWVTAYAHADQLLVKRGDKVRRGDVIAKAGNTGQVDQPQLHFELRQGSKPVDPLPYLDRL